MFWNNLYNRFVSSICGYTWATLFLTSAIVLQPVKHFRDSYYWSWHDFIYCNSNWKATCSDFRRHIRIGNNPMGTLASQTTALLTRISAMSWATSLTIMVAVVLSGYCYKIKSENIAFQIVDPYKIRCLKSDSRVFIVFITGLISCKVSNKKFKTAALLATNGLKTAIGIA
jgi:hypothetical protein